METLRNSVSNAEPPKACGCNAPPRRLCDLCEAAGCTFLASSLACLERHIAAEHADAARGTSVERARSHAREQNQRLADTWADDPSHRQHVTQLIGALPRGGELCVLGAANGNDLDLEALAAWFSEIHLVDPDGQGLERARDRQTATVRAKLVLRAELDFSGMIEHLDDWGEAFPNRVELGKNAIAAAEGIVRGLGRNFPATVSMCVVSQLALPFQRAWITSRANWGDLLSAMSAVHLATMAGATRAGGRGLLLFDVASSKSTPELGELRGCTRQALEAFVAEAREAGELHLRPEPQQLYMQLSAPGLRQLVSEPELGAPWLRRLGQDTQLVYSLEFAHPVSD